MLRERDLLLNCASTTPDEKLLLGRRRILENGNLDWNYLLDEADYQGCTALLYYHLQREKLEGFIPEKIFSLLEKKRYAIALNNLKLSQELKELTRLFTDRKLEFIILKGPILDEIFYPERGLRPFYDLDLLIYQKDLEPIEDILFPEGYVISTVLPSKRFYQQFHFQLPYVHKGKGIYIELHWELLPRWRVHSPRILEVWLRREALNKEGNFYSLSGEDMIIYLASHLDLHAYMNRYYYFSLKIQDYIFKRSNGNRLIWFSDLLETIKFFGKRINWERLQERARSWGIDWATLSNLIILQKLFSEEEILKGINLSYLPGSGWFKKNLVLMSKKFPFLSNKRGRVEDILGLRRPLSGLDLLEYIFPPSRALQAKYGLEKITVLDWLKYHLKCFWEGLRAVFLLIVKI